jgi:hypothetical protein
VPNYIFICAECERPLNPDDSMVKYLRRVNRKTNIKWVEPMRVCVDCYISGRPHYPPKEHAEEM